MALPAPALPLSGAPTRLELVSTRALAVVAAQVSVAGAALLYLNRTLAGDVYFLLASGRLLVEEGWVTRSPFPTLAQGHVWHNQQWLAEWLFFQVHVLGGMAAVSLAYATVLVGGLAPLAWLCRDRSAGATAAAWVLSIAALVAVLDPRAAGFSVALFAGVAALLLVARRRPGALFGLPVLFTVWANLHGAFPAGLMLVALTAAGTAVRSRRGRLPSVEPYRAVALLAALGASGVALLLTPLGLGLLAYLQVYDRHIAPHHLPFEWQATYLHPPVLALVVAFAVLAVWLWRRAPRPRPITPALLAVAFVVFALSATRQVVWLGPLAFYLVHALGPPRAGSPSPRGARSRVEALARRTAPAAGIAGLVLVLGWLALVGPAPPGPPQAAAATRRALADPPDRGRLVLPAGAGSYSLWRDPERPIAIDGRMELYTPYEVRSTYWLLKGQGVRRTLRRWRVGGVVTRSRRGVRVLRRHGFRVDARRGGAFYLVRR